MEIRCAGRATMGAHAIHFKEGDSIPSIARIAAEDLTAEENNKPDEKGVSLTPAKPVPEKNP